MAIGAERAQQIGDGAASCGLRGAGAPDRDGRAIAAAVLRPHHAPRPRRDLAGKRSRRRRQQLGIGPEERDLCFDAKLCRDVRSDGDVRPAHGLLPRFRRGQDSSAAQRRALGSPRRAAGNVKADNSDRCFVRPWECAPLRPRRDRDLWRHPPPRRRLYACGPFILAGDMAVAYFMAHLPVSFFPRP